MKELMYFGLFGQITLKILLVTVLLCILSSCESTERVEKKVNIEVDKMQTYKNPFHLEGEWDDYGNGDPYVMRHNGTYYLYVSTKDHRVGIKAWSSTNLVDWKYEGLVTEDPITTSAYAPEVVYYNGMFYMYTSPAGNGHYVLSSKNPTGPFVVQTKNLGMSIDGSVFIDDDGSWYFTHAGNTGIVGHKMKDPFTFDMGEDTGAYMEHWTEGSMIIKKNDRYYMTYTGNHVFSKGYRVNYAVSKESPLKGYEMPDNNPIIINTDDDFFGLGHNSMVLGPDLDSYYIVYHNLVGHSAEGPPVRQMNIDRLVFNEKRMDVLGPTNYEIPAPKQPDYEIRWTGEMQPINDSNNWEQMDYSNRKLWISPKGTDDLFTAEYNFQVRKEVQEACIGIVFSYKNEGNFAFASIDFTEKTLKIHHVMEGKENLLAEAALPKDLDFTKLHTIRVENREENTIVFIDGMKKLDVKNDSFGSGKIGYMFHKVDPIFGYTAFSNDVNSSSDFEVYKPIPGTIEAIHYLKGENQGYSIKNPKKETPYRENVPVRLTEEETYSVDLQNQEDWLKYKINVKEDAVYEISAVISADKSLAKTKVSFKVDDNEKHIFKIPEDSMVPKTKWSKVRLGRMSIQKGYHVLKMELEHGDIEWKRLEVYPVTKEKKEWKHAFDEVKINDIYGDWILKDGAYYSNSKQDMKMFVGDKKWTDMDVNVKFQINDVLVDEGGVLLRATNESDFEAQVRDSMMGYYISINTRKIALQKLNYDSTEIVSESVAIEPGKQYSLRVTANGNKIEIYFNGEKEPIISYLDPHAYMYGKVGVRSEFSEFMFKDLSINLLKND